MQCAGVLKKKVPIVDLPLGATEDRVCGTINIEKVLTDSGMNASDKAVMMANVTALADRVARNREIGGLHYRSDSTAGNALAQTVFDTLTAGSTPLYDAAMAAAAGEWS